MKIPAAKIYFPEEDKEKILNQVKKVLDSGWLTLGKFGRQFEEEFAKEHGAKYAVAVSSGTSALEIALRILEVRGKEVVIPTNTFFATASAVLHAGGKVRLADVKKDTFALDPESLRATITENTAGVIVVHIGGIISSDINEIKEICEEKGLFLLEDAAHAQGCSLNGQIAGTFGDAAAFSFYPTKVMTSGEGGMIVTSKEEFRKEASVYRDQGKSGFYGNYHIKLGYNWRMSELHAIIGLSQLHRLDEFIGARNRIANIYDEGLRDISGVEPLVLPEECRCNYYKYIILLEGGISRNKLKKCLKEKYEIGVSGEVYEVPLHLQPIFKEEYREGDFPVAEDICRRHICLPISAVMTDEEANYVLNSLEKTIKFIKRG